MPAAAPASSDPAVEAGEGAAADDAEEDTTSLTPEAAAEEPTVLGQYYFSSLPSLERWGALKSEDVSRCSCDDMQARASGLNGDAWLVLPGAAQPASARDHEQGQNENADDVDHAGRRREQLVQDDERLRAL
jgi:hypothetical protein